MTLLEKAFHKIFLKFNKVKQVELRSLLKLGKLDVKMTFFG